MSRNQSEFYPGAILHEVIVGAFRSRGTTFEGWAKENGLTPMNARNATFGQSRGEIGRANLERIRAFSAIDLAAHSNTPEVAVTPEAAREYCQMLTRAGYLRVERAAIPGRREAVYRLIKNTGPRPPMERRVRAVFDENLGEIVHVAGVPS